MDKINKHALYQLKDDRAEALNAAEAAANEERLEDYEAEMAKVKDFNARSTELRSCWRSGSASEGRSRNSPSPS